MIISSLFFITDKVFPEIRVIRTTQTIRIMFLRKPKFPGLRYLKGQTDEKLKFDG